MNERIVKVEAGISMFRRHEIDSLITAGPKTTKPMVSVGWETYSQWATNVVWSMTFVGIRQISCHVVKLGGIYLSFQWTPTAASYTPDWIYTNENLDYNWLVADVLSSKLFMQATSPTRRRGNHFCYLIFPCECAVVHYGGQNQAYDRRRYHYLVWMTTGSESNHINTHTHTRIPTGRWFHIYYMKTADTHKHTCNAVGSRFPILVVK